MTRINYVNVENMVSLDDRWENIIPRYNYYPISNITHTIPLGFVGMKFKFQVFSVYLVAFGLSWLIFLYCDIRRHQNRIRNQADEAKTKETQLPGFRVAKSVTTKSQPTGQSEQHHQGNKSQNNSNGNKSQRTAQNPATANPAFRLGSNDRTESPKFNRHAYIFCHSRHSGSFYLKIGAAGDFYA